MNNKLLASALTTALVALSSSGAALASPEYTGDSGTPPDLGRVTVGLDSYGGFGDDTSNPSRQIGDAVLSIPPRTEGTTVSSFVAARFGAGAESTQLTGPAQYIGSGSVKTATFPFYSVTYAGPGGTVIPDATPTATKVETDFSSGTLANLNFHLVQTIGRFDTNPLGSKQGTFLQQDYEITNNTSADVSGELLRYAAFALAFTSGAINDDGGGRVVIDGKDYLFTTESVVAGSTDTVYAAISAEILGQTTQTANRFEFGAQTGPDITADHVLANGEDGGILGTIKPLSNAVINDNGSGLAGNGGSYASALRNAFTIAKNSSITYRTTTYWGDGKIDDFVPPSNGGGGNPAPTPGSLMLFGLAGWGLSRIRKKQLHS